MIINSDARVRVKEYCHALKLDERKKDVSKTAKFQMIRHLVKKEEGKSRQGKRQPSNSTFCARELLFLSFSRMIESRRIERVYVKSETNACTQCTRRGGFYYGMTHESPSLARSVRRMRRVIGKHRLRSRDGRRALAIEAGAIAWKPSLKER